MGIAAGCCRVLTPPTARVKLARNEGKTMSATEPLKVFWQPG